MSHSRLWARLRAHRYFLIVVAIFLALAVWYNAVTPIGESDNELSHYRYVQYVKTNWQIPPIDYEWPTPANEDQCQYPFDTDPRLEERQFRQPPLYYTLSALTFFWVDSSDHWWPVPNQYGYHVGAIDGGRNAYIHSADEATTHRNVVLAVRLHRLFSTLAGVFGLLAAYLTGLLLLPSKRNWGASLMAAAVAFVPAYIFAAAVINNDILVGALGMWSLYFYLRSVIEKPDLKAFALGALFAALAFLSKYTAIVLIPAFGLTLVILLIKSWRTQPRRLSRTLIPLLGIIALQALPLAWWFLRNQAQYDNALAGYNPIGISFLDKFAYAISLLLADGVGGSSQTFLFTFNTYWGLLGADSVTLPQWMLDALLGVTLLIGLGLAVRLLRKSTDTRTKLAVVIGFIIIAVDWYLIFSLIFYGTRGRYILPLYSTFAFLFILGASVLGMKHIRWLGGIVYVGLLLIISVLVPVIAIAPTYAPPPIQTDPALFAWETPVQVEFGDLAELVGVQVEPQDIGPYMPVDVTLIWRVLGATANNYTVGVHLESADLVYLGGTTHWPGKGLYATSLWRPGDVFRDTYRFYTESGAEAKLPTGAKVKISVVCTTAQDENHLPIFDEAGALLGDAVYSRPVRFARPQTGELAAQTAPVLADYGGQIALTAYANVPDSLNGVSTLQLDLRWRAWVDLGKDYSVFVQLLDEENNILAGTDYPLTQDHYPSSLWLPGEEVEHQHDIDLSITQVLPFGTYRLVTGIYDVETGVRLPPVQDYERGIPEGYLLGTWDFENYLVYTPLIITPGGME